MGFFNFARNAALGLGKKVWNMASSAAPYVVAGVKTLWNHPGFVSQLGGLASGALGVGAQILTGNIAGAITSGAALVGLGSKTYSNVSKAYKEELAVAKGGSRPSRAGAGKKMDANAIGKLKEGVASIGKNKLVHPDPFVNINE